MMVDNSNGQDQKPIDNTELIFLRNFANSINAFLCVIKLNPLSIESVSDNSMFQTHLNVDPSYILKMGEFIANRLQEKPDFEESVVSMHSKFKKDPDTKWGGVLRINDKKTSIEWLVYTAAALERNEKNEVITVACAAMDAATLLNTPRTLRDFKQYISQQINEKELSNLTKRQREILKMIGQGFTTKEIASILEISIFTVEDHKKALFKKLDCRSMVHLARIAEKFGL